MGGRKAEETKAAQKSRVTKGCRERVTAAEKQHKQSCVSTVVWVFVGGRDGMQGALFGEGHTTQD